jgi:hypothetical protein
MLIRPEELVICRVMRYVRVSVDDMEMSMKPSLVSFGVITEGAVLAVSESILCAVSLCGQISKMTTFATINPTMTFLKPELKLFLTDIFRPGGRVPLDGRRIASIQDEQAAAAAAQPARGWVPKTFITFVDIFQDGWTAADYSNFFMENFCVEGGYDVIECTSDQINLVLSICGEMGVYPEMLIVHMEEDYINICDCSKHIRIFVLKQEDDVTLKIVVPNDDDVERPRDLLIYHPGTTIVAFIERDETSPSGYIPADVKFMQYAEEPQVDDYGTLIKPLSEPSEDYPNALISLMGMSDNSTGKELYIVCSGDARKGQSRFSSVVCARRSGEVSFNVENTDSNAAVTSGGSRSAANPTYVVVHGRPNSFNIEYSHNVKVLFPDMSESEISSIWKNKDMFIGNDRKANEYGSATAVGNYLRKYFVDGETIAEQVIGVLGKKSIPDNLPDSSILPRSLIDSYLRTLVFKEANGKFSLMNSKVVTKIACDEIEGFYQGKRFTDKLHTFIREHYERDSKFDIQRRDFLLARTEQLAKIAPTNRPYTSERAVIEPLMEEEQLYQKSIKDRLGSDLQTRSYDPQTRSYTSYDLPPISGGWQFIEDQDSVLIDGAYGYNCIVQNCGFVVARGKGTIRVSGTLHSLIVSEDVHIVLDNSSPSILDTEIFLYVRDGSIFDSIINFKDSLTQTEIDALLARPLEDLSSPDIIEANKMPPMNRSIIKNLYYHRRPHNLLTADVQNAYQQHAQT